jgi:subtilisin
MPAHAIAWSSLGAKRERLPPRWSEPVTRDWAWGGSTGRGVRVCFVDSGIEPDHPLVGAVDSAHVAVAGEAEVVTVAADDQGDVSGHGTACAGIVRALAPDCTIHSMRVLGADLTGTGRALLAGLEWAVAQGFDVINLSLSTRRRQFADILREMADDAYFQRSLLVCSAHNAPVEFFALGVDVEVAWLGGATTVVSGNSFATPRIAAICALILAKHPGLTPFEVKTALYATASNVG